MENLFQWESRECSVRQHTDFCTFASWTAQTQRQNYQKNSKKLELSQQENSAAEVKESAIDENPVFFEEDTLSGKKYFTILMNSFTDGEHEGHSALESKVFPSYRLASLRIILTLTSGLIASAIEKSSKLEQTDFPTFGILIRKAEQSTTWTKPTIISFLNMQQSSQCAPSCYSVLLLKTKRKK